MRGDGRVRFCDQCQKNVYNLADMPPAEAAGLVLKTEGRLCVRMYQRTDDTLLAEEDCPVGMALLWSRMKTRCAAAFAAFLGLAGLGSGASPAMGKDPVATTNEVHSSVLLGELQAVSTNEVIRMGDMATPPKVMMGKVAAPTASSTHLSTNRVTSVPMPKEIDAAEIRRKAISSKPQP